MKDRIVLFKEFNIFPAPDKDWLKETLPGMPKYTCEQAERAMKHLYKSWVSADSKMKTIFFESLKVEGSGLNRKRLMYEWSTGLNPKQLAELLSHVEAEVNASNGTQIDYFRLVQRVYAVDFIKLKLTEIHLEELYESLTLGDYLDFIYTLGLERGLDLSYFMESYIWAHRFQERPDLVDLAELIS